MTLTQAPSLLPPSPCTGAAQHLTDSTDRQTDRHCAVSSPQLNPGPLEKIRSTEIISVFLSSGVTITIQPFMVVAWCDSGAAIAHARMSLGIMSQCGGTSLVVHALWCQEDGWGHSCLTADPSLRGWSGPCLPDLCWNCPGSISLLTWIAHIAHIPVCPPCGQSLVVKGSL